MAEHKGWWHAEGICNSACPECEDEAAPCIKGTPGCSRKDGPHEDCEPY